jgi:hypothetical protein
MNNVDELVQVRTRQLQAAVQHIEELVELIQGCIKMLDAGQIEQAKQLLKTALKKTPQV